MTDKKVLWIRILIAITTFIVLSGTLISFFKNWFPGPIYTVLLILSFITLASGVSYLSDIFKKNVNSLRITTGALSIVVFLFTLFPLSKDSNYFISWGLVIILSLSAVLISVSLLLEFFQKILVSSFYSLIFALNSAIYSFFIGAIIFANTFSGPEAGYLVMGYSAVLFLVCIIVNLFVFFIEKKHE